MTGRLGLAAPDGAVRGADDELAAYLGRLLRWDKAAVVRLRSAAGEAALGVFGHPPFGGVLAVKSLALTSGGVADAVDATVSAGQLLDAVVQQAEEGGEFVLPGTVTGPAWAGLLPPRQGWQREALLDAAAVRQAAAVMVAEFRSRTEALLPEQRTRAELDALAEELWSRPLAAETAGASGDAAAGVTLRIVHAAHALGFLRSAGRGDEVAVLIAGPWVRLRTAHGSVAARRQTPGTGLAFSPLARS